MPLNRQPIYLQLSRELRDLVGSGEFACGDKFLTEREVTKRFDVSRATANKALANLVVEGVLEFRKGIGTFIRTDVMEYDIRSLVSFTDKARGSGRRPSTKVLIFAKASARESDEEAVAALGLAAGDAVFYLERLRLADRKPVIMERRHVVEKHCPGLSKSAVGGSLYALWAEKYGLDIEGAEETIRAVNISGSDARHLKIADGAAGLLVTSTGYLRDRRPLWHERTLYRGDAYEFRGVLGGVRPSRRVSGMLSNQEK